MPNDDAISEESNSSPKSAMEGSGSDVNRVAVKTPQFINDDPEMWLQLVDRSFTLSNIVSEDTKFSYVITSLEPRVVHEVPDIVMKPPAQPCTALKKALISRLSASQEQKTPRLLEKEEMGDSKQSQFLRRLRVLAGPSVDDSLLRTLWTGRLPTSLQGILATHKQKDLDGVAELADAVMETISPPASVCETRDHSSKDTATHDRCDRLERQVAELRKEIAKLTFSRRDDRWRQRSRSKFRARSSERIGQCWYHRRFGDKSQRCTQPCPYRAPSTTGNGENNR